MRDYSEIVCLMHAYQVRPHALPMLSEGNPLYEILHDRINECLTVLKNSQSEEIKQRYDSLPYLSSIYRLKEMYLSFLVY